MITDGSSNTCNIVGCLIMDKFDGKQMQDNFYEKTKFNKRFRSKLTKVLGMSYFKPMSEE